MTGEGVSGLGDNRREPSQQPWADRLEEYGGRLLAWFGGIAVMMGIAFLVGIAIDRGWIDETMRIVFGFLGSTSLLLVGAWLYERKGYAEAALAVVGSGLAGLYATLLVGTQVYELVPAYLGLLGAGLVGVVGVAIAVRWESSIVAGIGILGGLTAPALAGTGASWVSLAFMAVALSAAVGVVLWQKWNWLSFGAFLVSAPQLLYWVDANRDAHPLPVLGVLVGIWALYATAALGYELRTRRQDRLPVSSLLLLLADVALIATVGYFVLDQTGHPNGAVAWLLGLAAGHILLGAVAFRREVNREIGSLLGAVGLGLRLRKCPARPLPGGRLGDPGGPARLPGNAGQPPAGVAGLQR
ncbi:MAG: DUF2339 domain-containing protein [Solirubrobacterales bacterium]